MAVVLLSEKSKYFETEISLITTPFSSYYVTYIYNNRKNEKLQLTYNVLEIEYE